MPCPQVVVRPSMVKQFGPLTGRAGWASRQPLPRRRVTSFLLPLAGPSGPESARAHEAPIRPFAKPPPPPHPQLVVGGWWLVVACWWLVIGGGQVGWRGGCKGEGAHERV